jgi:hypothetical protein
MAITATTIVYAFQAADDGDLIKDGKAKFVGSPRTDQPETSSRTTQDAGRRRQRGGAARVQRGEHGGIRRIPMNTRSRNTGGNIDTTFLATIRQRRLAKLSVIVTDRPGIITEFAAIATKDYPAQSFRFD